MKYPIHFRQMRHEITPVVHVLKITYDKYDAHGLAIWKYDL